MRINPYEFLFLEWMIIQKEFNSETFAELTEEELMNYKKEWAEWFGGVVG